MVNKDSVDYHPSLSEVISRIHTLIFLWTPKRFISPESFLNFFLNLYIPPWLQKCFKLIVLRILQIHLWIKKLNLFIFTHAPNQNPPPGFYHNPPCRKKLPIFSKDIFSWGERGKRIMELNKIPKLTKVSVKNFDKFPHLSNLYIFGLCFVAQWFSFKHAEVW